MDELADIFGAALTASQDGEGSSVEDAVATPSSEEVAKAEAERTGSVPTTEVMCRLASYVTSVFRDNAEYRRSSGVDDRLREAILAQTCRYTAEQEEKLRRAGISKDIYTPVTSTKVRAAKAMLVDIFNASGEWPFTLQPTPVPTVPESELRKEYMRIEAGMDLFFRQLEDKGVEELPPAVMMQIQQMATDYIVNRYDELKNREEAYAKTRARRLEKRIQDCMAEGGWIDAYQEYVNYICTYGTGIVIGPVPRVVAQNRCKENARYGTRKYVREYRQILTYEAVNPVDCYPAPDAKDVDDGPLCIRVKYQPNELRAYSDANANKSPSHGAEGWNLDTIRSLLAKWPKGGCRILDEERDRTVREAENHSTDDTRDSAMEGIRCFASVRGSDLLELGITRSRDGKKVKHDDYYATETIVIDGYVVYCRIIDDKLGRPVSKGVFYEVPGSWWGESVASKCRMVQSVMNNAIKALMQNMAVASGPMYYINDIGRLADKSPDALKFSPHKFIAFNSSMVGNQGAPVGAVTVPSNASELLAVFNAMKQQADDDSGIPAYSYGQSSGQGALRTASGLAILTEATSRGMKMVINTTDRLVVRDQVEKTANWLMLYDKDQEIKGDCTVLPSGVMGKILKAQQDQQRMQFLNLALTNQTLSNIIGPKGLAALLRPTIQDLAINPDDCLPSAERLEEMELLQSIQQIMQTAQMQNEAQQAQLGMEGLEAGGGAATGGMPQQGAQIPAPAEQGGLVQQEAAPGLGGGVAERRSVA